MYSLYTKGLAIFFACCLLLACESEEADPVPFERNQVNFVLSAGDGGFMPYTNAALSSTDTSNVYVWNSLEHIESENEALIVRQIAFRFGPDTLWAYCPTFSLTLSKVEAKYWLRFNGQTRHWEYKNQEDEIRRLYQEYDYATVYVGHCYEPTQFSVGPDSEAFTVNQASVVRHNGQDRIMLDASFSGFTRQYPFDASSPRAYELKEGRILAVLE